MYDTLKKNHGLVMKMLFLDQKIFFYIYFVLNIKFIVIHFKFYYTYKEFSFKILGPIFNN
jgi:hypothetical protein